MLTQLTLEHFGARAEWIPITNGDNDSANDPLAANSINQVAAVFIDDGYPHVLVRLLQNRDGTGNGRFLIYFVFFLSPPDASGRIASGTIPRGDACKDRSFPANSDLIAIDRRSGADGAKRETPQRSHRRKRRRCCHLIQRSSSGFWYQLQLSGVRLQFHPIN